MEVCERCGITGDQVRLFDAIYDGKMSVLCERCSILENILIIKKPNSNQLVDAEKGFAVYDRMKRLSGLVAKKNDTFFREDKLKELDSKPELIMPEKDKLKLIENFHWVVVKNRRRKGLSNSQLAEEIGESEIAIEMIEKGKLPENAESVINKLEQLFQVFLRKRDNPKIGNQEEEKPILLDDKGNELTTIPEEEIEIIDDTDYDESIDGEKIEYDIEDNSNDSFSKEDSSDNIQNAGKTSLSLSKTNDGVEEVFEINKTNSRNVSIGDLKAAHRKKVEATRLEQIEEQKKIEERRRILQALRERDRMKQEEKRKIDLEEKKRLIAEKRREEEEKRRQDSKELDSYLGGSELLEGE